MRLAKERQSKPYLIHSKLDTSNFARVNGEARSLVNVHAAAPASIMEHSTAILEDAGKAIDAAAASSSLKTSLDFESTNPDNEARPQNNYNRRKRKGGFPDSSMHQGSQRGGRGGGGRNNNKRHKKGDMGRGEYLYVLINSSPTLSQKPSCSDTD